MDPISIVKTIPQALSMVTSLGSLFQSPYTPPKVYEENSREVFKAGGKIRGYNKYNAPSHSKGGMAVNDNGMPTPGGTNEIEKNESKYTYSNIKSGTYVFTPEDQKKVTKLTNKYKKADKDPTQKNTLELEIQRVEKANEMKKAKRQEFKNGGKIKKYNTGGPLGNLEPALRSLQSLFTPMEKGFSTPGDGPAIMIPKSTDFLNDYMQRPISSNEKVVPGLKGGSPTLKSKLGNERVSTDTYTNRAIASTNNQTGNPLTSTPKPQKGPLDQLNALRDLTMSLSFGSDLLRRPEREKPIMTDYGKARKEMNKLDANLDPLREQVAQSSNQLRAVNRDRSGSANTMMNREAQRVANLQQSLSQVAMQELNLKNNIAAQRAGFEANVARDNKQTLQQNRINNQQNQAAANRIRSEVNADIVSEIDRKSKVINNANIAKATRDEGMALMSSLFSNFKPQNYDLVYKVATKGYESLSVDEKKTYDNLKLIGADV